MYLFLGHSGDFYCVESLTDGTLKNEVLIELSLGLIFHLGLSFNLP